MEIDSAVRRELLADPTVAGYVGDKVYRHTIWERLDNVNGARAILVKRQGGWAVPDRIKTPEWPQILIECWADADRDTDGEVKADNGMDNAFAVYRAVDNFIHSRAPGRWGQTSTNQGIQVIGKQRLQEPVPFGPNDVSPDAAVSMGDLRYCSVLYGFQVVHGTLVG